MEAVKNNCTLQVVNITHNNVTRSGFTSIKQCIENLQHSIQIYASWNEINESGKLITKISTSCATDNIEVDVWSFDEHDTDHLVMCLIECLKEDDTLQELDLSQVFWRSSNYKVTNERAKMIGEAIKLNTTLHTLNLGQYISDALSFNMTVLTAVYHNNTLMKLELPYVYDDDDKRLVSSEVEKINKERTRQGISTLTCHYTSIHYNIMYDHL